MKERTKIGLFLFFVVGLLVAATALDWHYCVQKQVCTHAEYQAKRL